MVRLMCDESRCLFPITRIDQLLTLFRTEFIHKSEPNVALASIILGALEHSLTSTPPPATASGKVNGKSSTQASSQGSNHQHQNLTPSKRGSESDFPVLDNGVILGLYEKFRSMLKTRVDMELLRSDLRSGKGTSRDLVKNVSDVIWNSLSRTYIADKPHLQSLFTYLTGAKLDSFGMALGVVAGCQLLGLTDVHLALSEDHAWAVFGSPKAELSAEVTWHGKGGDDHRGQAVNSSGSSWLYLKGQAVHCTRNMEIAATVSAINPSITGSSFDSAELALIQQTLLWELYDAGHLSKYPMAIGTLGELEEISPSIGRKLAADLFAEGIRSSQKHYGDLHVYPYTSFAAYLLRQLDDRATLKQWARAANVIAKYGHGGKGDDEEMYREFLEISTDHLQALMKRNSGDDPDSLTHDPAALSHLLEFMDGICCWEESSRTPLLHIVWAKAWIGALRRFDYKEARRPLQLISPEEQVTNGTELVGDKPQPALTLRSSKMQGLKDLLVREKFNPAALTLHLTAQPHQATPTSNNAQSSRMAGSVDTDASRIGTSGRKRVVVPKRQGLDETPPAVQATVSNSKKGKRRK